MLKIAILPAILVALLTVAHTPGYYATLSDAPVTVDTNGASDGVGRHVILTATDNGTGTSNENGQLPNSPPRAPGAQAPLTHSQA